MPACVLADSGHLAHMMWSGWSRLIWHNFIKVAGNWIKIRSLVQIGTHNRHIKFGWKISNRFRKIATSLQGGFFYSHCISQAYCSLGIIRHTICHMGKKQQRKIQNTIKMDIQEPDYTCIYKEIIEKEPRTALKDRIKTQVLNRWTIIYTKVEEQLYTNHSI